MIEGKALGPLKIGFSEFDINSAMKFFFAWKIRKIVRSREVRAPDAYYT